MSALTLNDKIQIIFSKAAASEQQILEFFLLSTESTIRYFVISLNSVICHQNESQLKIGDYRETDEGDVCSFSEDHHGDSSADITLLKLHFEMQISIWY